MKKKFTKYFFKVKETQDRCVWLRKQKQITNNK
jgi:hypothetical protein